MSNDAILSHAVVIDQAQLASHRLAQTLAAASQLAERAAELVSDPDDLTRSVLGLREVLEVANERASEAAAALDRVSAATRRPADGSAAAALAARLAELEQERQAIEDLQDSARDTAWSAGLDQALREAEALPITTLAEAVVVARAIDACHRPEPVEFASGETTSDRLAAKLATALAGFEI